MGINNPGSGDGVWTLLHDETLAALGRFDVSGISQVHSSLRILLYARTDVVATVDGVYLLFNGDTTVTNYRFGDLAGGDAGAVAVGADVPQIGGATAASAPAGSFGLLDMVISDYAGSSSKLASSIGGQARAVGTIVTNQTILNWENTAAITQITLQPDGHAADEFVADSRLQIWGIS